LWNTVDSFTARIYTFFTRGRVGESLSSKNTLCRQSFLANTFKKHRHDNAVTGGLETVVEQSSVSVFLRRFSTLLASLKLNVYGFFLTFYGIAAALMSYVSVLMGSSLSSKIYVMITSGIIALCGIPLIFSGCTAAQAISRSKFMRRVVLDFFDVPEEKLNTPKQYGRTESIFISSVAALALGVLTYFFDPIIVPLAFLAIITLVLIFVNPETGVVITLASTPLLQYFELAKEALLILIAVTAAAYLLKVVQRRRMIALSPEIVMVMLFCGFTVAAGMFSQGGAQTLIDSVSSAVIIMGGFFLTYNLIHTEKEVSIFTKTLLVSFVLQCLVGIWDGFYNGISRRIIDSVSSHTVDMSKADVDILYIADSGVVFGMFAILVFPLMFAFMARRKSAKGVFALIILSFVAIIAAFMCSNYEIIVAMVIECVVFWILYSHKSLTVIFFAAIPISIIAILYPYAMVNLGAPNFIELITEYMPASISDTAMHTGTVSSVIEMIFDGHFTGIGAGQHAFVTVHSAYANAVSACATDPLSMWLQVLCWSGIFGFISFLLFVAFLIKRSFAHLTNPYQRHFKGMALAMVCGLIMAMLFGTVYSIWSDPRMLYLFWTCTGILMGQIKVGNSYEEKRLAEQLTSLDGATAELIFYK
jgi:hypothetical protein